MIGHCGDYSFQCQTNSNQIIHTKTNKLISVKEKDKKTHKKKLKGKGKVNIDLYSASS